MHSGMRDVLFAAFASTNTHLERLDAELAANRSKDTLILPDNTVLKRADLLLPVASDILHASSEHAEERENAPRFLEGANQEFETAELVDTTTLDDNRQHRKGTR